MTLAAELTDAWISYLTPPEGAAPKDIARKDRPKEPVLSDSTLSLLNKIFDTKKIRIDQSTPTSIQNLLNNPLKHPSNPFGARKLQLINLTAVVERNQESLLYAGARAVGVTLLYVGLAFLTAQAVYILAGTALSFAAGQPFLSMSIVSQVNILFAKAVGFNPYLNSAVAAVSLYIMNAMATEQHRQYHDKVLESSSRMSRLVTNFWQPFLNLRDRDRIQQGNLEKARSAHMATLTPILELGQALQDDSTSPLYQAYSELGIPSDEATKKQAYKELTALRTFYADNMIVP